MKTLSLHKYSSKCNQKFELKCYIKIELKCNIMFELQFNVKLNFEFNLKNEITIEIVKSNSKLCWLIIFKIKN